MKNIAFLTFILLIGLFLGSCRNNLDYAENTSETCSDNIDNDADGLFDFEDPDCAAFSLENTKELCTDGIDNNHNELFDCADTDCTPFCNIAVPTPQVAGILPTAFNYSNLDDQFNIWYDKFYEESSDGSMARITRDNEAYTVSEGIGYGMLIMLGMDKKDEFVKLWNYYKHFENNHGVMNWCIEGFTQIADPCDHNGSKGSNGATDAELDVVTALIIGARKWNDTELLADAKILAQSIFTYEVESSKLLKPGDVWGGVYNPSYISLVALRLMQEIQPENQWDVVLQNNANYLFSKCFPLSNGTGLYPDWADEECLEDPGYGYNYGYEAFRTVMRIAWYNMWYNDPTAANSSITTANWIDDYTGGDILKAPGLGIAITGTTDTPTTSNMGAAKYSFCMAATAVGTDGSNFQHLVEQCNTEMAQGKDQLYYSGSLKIITMLLYSGKLAYIP